MQHGIAIREDEDGQWFLWVQLLKWTTIEMKNDWSAIGEDEYEHWLKWTRIRVSIEDWGRWYEKMQLMMDWYIILHLFQNNN